MSLPRKEWFLVLAIIFLGAYTGADNEKPNQIEIDILKGLINGRAIFEMNLDEMSDFLGRPSEVKRVPFFGPDEFGPIVTYLQHGVWSMFEHRVGERQKCTIFSITLRNSKDGVHSNQLQPFEGKLSRGMNRGWTVENVKAEFSDQRVIDPFDPDLYARLKLSSKAVGPRWRSQVRAVMRSMLLPVTDLIDPGLSERMRGSAMAESTLGTYLKMSMGNMLRIEIVTDKTSALISYEKDSRLIRLLTIVPPRSDNERDEERENILKTISK